MRTISVFCFVSRNSQEMKDMKMHYIKLQIAVSYVDSHDIQNVHRFSDLGVFFYVLLTLHLSIFLDNDQIGTRLLCFTIRLL